MKYFKVFLRGVRKIWRAATAYDRRMLHGFCAYDESRFYKYSGVFRPASKETMLANIVIRYHVVEKGLAMPNRRPCFGQPIVLDLIRMVEAFVSRFGRGNPQVCHAVGTLKTYYDVHSEIPRTGDFWDDLCAFLEKFHDISASCQIHVTRDDYFKEVRSDFRSFAWARHSVRNYSNKRLPISRIRDAVELAMSAPSACNRQHVRVHCISSRKKIEEVLGLQNGNRGFGVLADKVLVVTADLADLTLMRERNDIYVNGGIFLMNLSYSLFYFQIAHCILNWSATVEEDFRLRATVEIPNSETVIAMITCGEAPEEFDLALSPRRELKDVFFME